MWLSVIKCECRSHGWSGGPEPSLALAHAMKQLISELFDLLLFHWSVLSLKALSRFGEQNR